MAYEMLMMKYPHVLIKEKKMPKGLFGLYFENEIHINKYLSEYEKHCTLAEELGHFETTYGDITDQSIVRNRQLENFARRWAYKKVVSLEKIVECYLKGHTTLEDMCVHLEVTPSFLKTSIDYYLTKYGNQKTIGDYTVSFDPLNVWKIAK